MPDNLRIKGPADQNKINVHEPHEVQYWTKTLGVTPAQLRSAVNAVGVSVAKVKEYLKKK